jgi:hypothetical protein
MPMPASASDWIRFKKLKASVGYDAVVSGTRDLQNPQPLLSSSRAGGTSRTRREASKWTDFAAAQQHDFITTSEYSGVFGSFGRQFNRTQLCANGTTCLTSVLNTKPGILTSAIYQRSRIL